MILCLHIGNTHLAGGVFDGSDLRVDFRRTSNTRISADEFGLFLRSILLNHEIPFEAIDKVAMSSVLPEATHALESACRKYLSVEPLVLKAGVRTGLKIGYRNPVEVGADRIARAVAAIDHYPQRELVVASFGTATTFCVIGSDKNYLGGVIMPGMRTSLEALVTRAAKLSSVEIAAVDRVLGRSTAESIQTGLYHGQIGMTREILGGIRDQVFGGRQPLVVGTGEFSGIVASSGLLDEIRPQLVLEGLLLASTMNS